MRFNQNTLLIIVLLSLSVLLFIIYWYITTTKEGMEDKNTANLMLFFADWCPHCIKARPEWDSFKSSMDGKVVNGYKLMFSEYDDKNKDMMSKYDVSKFPTIKLIKDGEIIDLDKNTKLNKDNLLDFINSSL
jgi:thiol-disulfide isomerase/thioredoxin